MTKLRAFITKWPFYTAAIALLVGLGVGGGQALSAGSARDRALNESRASAEQLTSTQAALAELRSRFSDLSSQLADVRLDLTEAESKLRARAPLPDFVGDKISDARDRIEARGWDLVVKKRESSRAKGTILDQSPEPGTFMSLGRNVTLIVAKPIEQTYAAPSQTCPNGTYTNVDGNEVCRPYSSDTVPAGATARCADGTYSFSQHRQGTCSYHGGVAEWL